ncbi:MAG: Protein of unknown function DUF357 [Candidatus Parvarchaeum acidophilus ARMAN-5]|jgi:hypothetical protein|uniref:DUF357 domain-containing protein n=1 Tax=Candidatus Parvarchaeum acidophilus ARMAN-5 TaxID=662762 RepID=D6GUG1_PARA5|nr:MAG: Protein of unknown function DUF357 [Candidatus Parvarchaeum acidophilus ARMAN-5]
MINEVKERAEKEIGMMKKVFNSISLIQENDLADEFFNMAFNYFKDSEFFFEKTDYIRAFEAVVISWSYVDAGLKAGFFSVSDDLKEYFTAT